MWRVMMLAVRLTFVMFVGHVSVFAGAKLVYQGDDRIYDPLTLYPAIMPGEAMTALEDYPCNWSVEATAGLILNDCQMLLEDRRFTLAFVLIHDLIIDTVSLRPIHLRVGDMPQYWGLPSFEQYTNYAIAQWQVDDYHIMAYVETNGRFSNWSSISYLTIRQSQPENPSQ